MTGTGEEDERAERQGDEAEWVGPPRGPRPGVKGAKEEEIYAEIARLSPPERRRLVARLLLDLAAEVESDASDPVSPAPLLPDVASRPGEESPAIPDERQSAEAPPRSVAPSPSRSPAPSSPRPHAAPGISHPAPRAERASPRLIVDGSNFLGTVPGFDLASAKSREKLILRLQEYARRHLGTRVVVFFDGKSASATVRSGLEIRFSPAAKTADQQIVAFLQSVPKRERGEALLVTADTELAERARALGVRVEAPLRFRARIPDPPRPPSDRGLSPAEVAEWEEYFRKGRNR